MTQLDPISTEEEVPAEDITQARNAIRVIALFTVSSLGILGFLAFQAARTPSLPQLWTVVVITAIVIGFMFAGLVVARRGRHERGIWLAFVPWLLLLVFIVAFVSGLGFVFMAVSISIITLISGVTLPSRQATIFNIVGAVTAVIILLVDILIPTERIAIPGFDTVAIVVVGALVLVFGYTTLRQFGSYSLRTKLLVAIIGVTVIAVGVLGVFVIRTAQSTLENQIGNSFAERAENDLALVNNFFLENTSQLYVQALNDIQRGIVEERNATYTGSQTQILAQIKALDEAWIAAPANDPFVQSIISEKLNISVEQLTDVLSNFPNHTELILTDRYGATVAATGHLSDYYQGDEEWWQLAWNNGEGALYISEPEYDESAGVTALLIAIPITEEDSDKPIGVLRSTLNINALYAILGEQGTGESGHTVLLDSNGDVLLDPRADVENSAGLPLEFRQEFIGEEAHFDVFVDQHGHEMIFGHASLTSEVGGEAHGHAAFYTELEEQIVDTVAEFGWAIMFRQETEEAFAPVVQITQTILVIGIIVLTLAVIVSMFFGQLLSNPIVRLTAVAEDIAGGNIDARAEVTSTDEVGTLATAFNAMTSQLQETLGGLEQRVAARTQDLELAAEVGRSVSQVRALDVMLKDACELILEQFDLYYVQVYLTDSSQTNLVLEAGTGEVGNQLLERGFSLPLNTGSLNGRAAVEKRAVVISDTAQSATFRQNPLLPETRGEMAVPLMVGERVVGVLDMQTSYPGKLTEEVLPAFEALAGQLAVAIQNANLLAQAEQARAEVEAQARRQVRASWGEHLDAIHKPEQIGFMFDRQEVTPFTETEVTEAQENEHAVSSPIYLSGEPLGSLMVEMQDDERKEQTSELVTIVARQVAQQIENLRLLESAERFRQEAEETSSRQTIEGWQAYVASRTAESLGYMYDLNEVLPHSNGQDDANALNLPLKARDETVGKLSVQGLAPDDKESFDLASAVAERLGAHIESLRLFEETRRGQMELDKRAQQLAAVAQVSTASSQEMDVQTMLETVVHLTQRQFGLYHAHVFTYLEDSDELQIMACGYREGDEHEGTHGTTSIPVTQEQSLVARAARTRQAVMVNDVRSEPGWLPNPLLPETRSELAVPMIVGDRLLGVLDVQSENQDHFTKEDANIQLTLASQVAIALQNAYSFAQAQRQAEREGLLNAINQKIQGATSVEAVLQIAARELGHALGAPMTIAQLSMKDQK